MRLLFQLVLLTVEVLTQLTYEKGYITLNAIMGPTTVTNTVTFTNSFQKIPQIILQPSTISIPNNQNDIQLKISSVTLTNFQYKLICPLNVYQTRYYFDWLAIIEDRILVLNPPLETIVSNGAIFTYSHTLSYATQAIVILNSIGYLIGPFDFQVSVYSVTNTNVQIQLVNADSKIQSIGYQIILGTKEAFYTTAVQKTGSGNAILGQYTVKILQNSLLYYPFIGFNWNGADNIRIQSSYTIVSSDYKYTFNTWSGTVMTSVTFQSIQFFTQILFPYYAHKYRVSKQFVEFPTNQILVKFIELNQNFNSDTFQTFNLLSTQTQLNIEIEIALSSGKKVQGYFLKCNDCGNNNKHIINQSYYSQGSFIKYRIRLLQYTTSVATLIFSMTSNKILIQQVINQAVGTYDLILLELINV